MSTHFLSILQQQSTIFLTFWQQVVHIFAFNFGNKSRHIIFWHFGSKLSTYWRLILAAKVHIIFAHVGSICPQIYFTIWQQITNMSVLWGRILFVEATWQMFHFFFWYSRSYSTSHFAKDPRFVFHIWDWFGMRFWAYVHNVVCIYKWFSRVFQSYTG